MIWFSVPTRQLEREVLASAAPRPPTVESPGSDRFHREDWDMRIAPPPRSTGTDRRADCGAREEQQSPRLPRLASNDRRRPAAPDFVRARNPRSALRTSSPSAMASCDRTSTGTPARGAGSPRARRAPPIDASSRDEIDDGPPAARAWRPRSQALAAPSSARPSSKPRSIERIFHLPHYAREAPTVSLARWAACLRTSTAGSPLRWFRVRTCCCHSTSTRSSASRVVCRAGGRADGWRGSRARRGGADLLRSPSRRPS